VIMVGRAVGLLDLEKGNMMKKTFISTVLGLFLCSMLFCLCGCGLFQQPGETVAEGLRRRGRVLRLNQNELMSDVDMTLHLDKPSKLTDKRIP